VSVPAPAIEFAGTVWTLLMLYVLT
jgi:hypothetical protein